MLLSGGVKALTHRDTLLTESVQTGFIFTHIRLFTHIFMFLISQIHLVQHCHTCIFLTLEMCINVIM